MILNACIHNYIMYQPSGVFSCCSPDSPGSAGVTGMSAGGMDGTVWVN